MEFKKIDTKEKAYILGFLLADGAITKDDKLNLKISLPDREVLDFISEQTGANIQENRKMDKDKRRYPYAGIKIGQRAIVNDLKKLFGGRLKEDRRIPIIKKDLEPFMVQGFFDADGCISWGVRKDRDRIWQKVVFTSQYKLLEGIQNILVKNGISTTLRPKSNENCYVLETHNKNNVLKALDYIYQDENFIILNRKYHNANALRLELGEFGESLNGQSRAEPAEQEGVETTGETAMSLNDRNQYPSV